MSTAPTRAPFAIIVATLTLDAMGIGLILPVMPALIEDLRGQGISDAALWGGLLAFSFAAMQFLFGPLLGNLSDRFGRRPVLILSLVAMGVNYLIMALAPYLWLLFTARVLSGIAASTHATATAYLADISAKGERAANFGLVGAAFGVGFILGPALGGLLGEFGPRAPFWAAAALSLGTAIFGAVYLRESLAPAHRRPFDLARANPFRAIARIRAIPNVGGLLWADFLYKVSNYVYPAIWSYFTIARFGWSPGMIGLSLAAFGISSAFVQGWLIRRLLKRLGEWRVAGFGLSFHAVSLTLIALIPSGPLVFVFMPLVALAVVAGPPMQGLMANRLPDSEQGELQGVLAATNAISIILSPLIMTGIFRLATVEGGPVDLPGAPFVAASLLAAGALAILLRAKARAPVAV